MARVSSASASSMARRGASTSRQASIWPNTPSSTSPPRPTTGTRPIRATRSCEENSGRSEGTVALIRFDRQPTTRGAAMPTPAELLTANLHQVFGNRDAASRRAAIDAAYTEDVAFTDPEETVTGRDAVEQKAAALLDGAPAEFVFTEEGLAYTDAETG